LDYKRKLIEVSLPLEAINKESAREKSIRHGHPSTLHLWWSRKPLATARAVLFASLVDDPSEHSELFPTEEAQDKERQRLFDMIEKLVHWENTGDEALLVQAREEIGRYAEDGLPPVLDPFCGGGSIPYEAQRLGFKAYAGDLNPVAVLITKAMIEIPARFSGMPPINPEARVKLDRNMKRNGASGLAEDVAYYGRWMRDEAYGRIGQFYPEIDLPDEYGGGKASAIAWIWARTVKCPNPACGCEMPLTSEFWLSKKKGKEAWIEPVADRVAKNIVYKVHKSKGDVPDGTVNRRGARCAACGMPIGLDHVRAEAKAGRMGAHLMAVVAEGKNGRIYLPPEYGKQDAAYKAVPQWKPEGELFGKARVSVPLYGMTKYADLFTSRQLTALTTFCDLVAEARVKAAQDAEAAGMNEASAKAYADAISVYLAFAVDKLADYCSSICSWIVGRDTIRNTFARQAIPMVWDYAESNPFSGSTGNFLSCVEWCVRFLKNVVPGKAGCVVQNDAMKAMPFGKGFVISTDPPYYDNIGYSDLSDFFYIWLRRSLKDVYPDLFSTVMVPKAQELVATPYHFGGDSVKARRFFEDGLIEVFKNMREAALDDYPITIYYAFKQSEAESDGDGEHADMLHASTGWETMLNGLISAGFAITGTWPMRTEMSNRPVANGTNALASSIVLVCRKRPEDALPASRRQFTAALRRELSAALSDMQSGNIPPVDLAQAAIGPGMGVFSRYSAVLEADGTPMTVRSALQIINQELDAYLASQEGDMDAHSRFCTAWYEQFGMAEADYGQADVLSRAKNTSVDKLAALGVLASSKGKVRLLRRDELKPWDELHSDAKGMVWMCVQQMARALEKNGEDGAASIAAKISAQTAEDARSLAYRLYVIADRKGWNAEAYAYNALVVSWPAIQSKAGDKSKMQQMSI
jgi:putative DNA methylase